MAASLGLERVREQRGLRWIENGAADTRYAVRQFRRTPVATFAMVLVLSVGIGTPEWGGSQTVEAETGTRPDGVAADPWGGDLDTPGSRRYAATPDERLRRQHLRRQLVVPSGLLRGWQPNRGGGRPPGPAGGFAARGMIRLSRPHRLSSPRALAYSVVARSAHLLLCRPELPPVPGAGPHPGRGPGGLREPRPLGHLYGDAAILEAARAAGFAVVLSEDLWDGEYYEGVRAFEPAG